MSVLGGPRDVRRLVALLALGGGLGCGGEVGWIEAQSGAVEGLSAGMQEWASAQTGAKLSPGLRLRTQEEGAVSIRLSLGGVLGLEPGTEVLFLEAREPEEGRIRMLAHGVLDVETASAPIVVEAERGTVVFQPGSRGRVRPRVDGIRFEVTQGNAQVHTERGPKELMGGRALDIELDGRAVEGPQLTEQRSVIAASGRDKPEQASAPAPSVSDTVTFVPQNAKAKIREGSGTTWRPVAAANPIAVLPGTTIKLLEGKATFRKGQGGMTFQGSGEVTVLLPSGTDFLEIKEGSGELFTGPNDLGIRTSGGSIVVRGRAGAESRATVRVARVSTNVYVSAGRVELKAAKEQRSLGEGEAAMLRRSGTVRMFERKDAQAPIFMIDVGGTATVHDVKAPSRVGLRVPEGCVGASFEIGSDGSKYRSSSDATPVSGGFLLQIPHGVHHYRIRCQPPGPLIEGVLRVLRDAGTAAIGTASRAKVIDSDGRRDVALFDNRLPELSFRWVTAPPSEEYVLNIESEGGELRTFQAQKKAEKKLAEGTLNAGTYRWWFETSDAAKLRSLVSTLAVELDPRAPAAQIASPKDDFVRPATGKIEVKGVAISGSSVRLPGGKLLSLDSRARFSGEFVLDSSEKSFAIEVQHPLYGSHFYIRHLKR